MPSKKRYRRLEVKQRTAARASQVQPTSLKHFRFLPPELRRLIINFACAAPARHDATCSFDQDLATMLNISLVSHEFRAQVLPSLLRHLSVTRNSSLYALHHMLQQYPARAALIKSLHIGPRQSLPAHWWPLTDPPFHILDGTSSCDWIRTSLNQEELPSGCASRQAWPIGKGKFSGCRDVAIREAIAVAERTLSVKLSSKGRGNWGSDIGTAWVPRVMEVQAILDLYLQHLRTREQESPWLIHLPTEGPKVPMQCRNGTCNHWPPLFIAGLAPSAWSPTPPDHAVKISRNEVLSHLARPGSATDCFDHPLFFARSGFQARVIRSHGPYRAGEDQPSARYELHSQSWNVAVEHECHDVAIPLSSPPTMGDDEQSKSHEVTKMPAYAAALGTSSFASLLYLARRVLTHLTSLDNLSLTSYLERAIRDEAVPTLSQLRRLTLGPPPPCWRAAPPLPSKRQLGSITELRIAGAGLTWRNIECITQEMPQLRVFEWSFHDGFEVLIRDQPSLPDAIERLRYRVVQPDARENGQTYPSQGTGTSRHTTRTGLVARDAQAPPLVRIRVNQVVADQWLASAPSPDVRRAFRANSSRPGATLQLQLVVAKEKANEPAGGNSLPRWRDSASAGWGKLYEEGREWRCGEVNQ